MIRTLSDLLRLYGDRTVLTIGASHIDGGRRSVVTFEIDHPGECQMCLGEKRVPCSSWPGHSHVCDECSGSGLALDIGGES